ncbi:fungal-specific transcription factor domain-containing protein [Dipodascopsis tothii]|uniref:fungal-specific transcription factor domain-containing protein n=1 Tax=Dipodascopsis tothii TaxID=44089 RepID=UPI0034D01BF9
MAPQILPSQLQMSQQQSMSTHLLAYQQSGKSRPCDSCRRRKSRCFIPPNEDSCVLCRFRKQECTFIEGPKPRRKRESQGAESMVPSKLPKTGAASPASSGSPPETVPIRDTLPVEDYSMIRGNSLLKKTLGLQNPRWSTYIGASSVLDYSLFSAAEFDHRDETELAQGVSLRKVAADAMFEMEKDSSIEGYHDMVKAVDDIERVVAPHGPYLVELYFRIVHPSFPILHKKVFLEKYSRTHREFSPPLLAGVYSLALHWWHYDSRLSLLPKPDADKLNRLAMLSFADVIMRPKLSTVQAGLLLLQRRYDGAGDWALCSQVVALAEELGLGIDCDRWRVPKWERNLRRRLAWAVWMQDKWHALTQSRPSHIDKRNWLVKHVTVDDFPEKAEDESDKDGSAEVENGRRLFEEMIHLSEVVHEILNTFFTFEAERELRDVEDVLKKAKPIQIKLKEWYGGLPESLRMSSMKVRKLSSNGNLHLAYFSTEITLHRRIIHSLGPDTPEELVRICRAAARERLSAAIEFVRALKHEHLQAFWQSTSSTNFALIGTFAALLMVTAPFEDEVNYYKSCLDDYIWILRLSSRGFSQMHCALQKLNVAVSSLPHFRAADDDGKPDDADADADSDAASDSLRRSATRQLDTPDAEPVKREDDFAPAQPSPRPSPHADTPSEFYYSVSQSNQNSPEDAELTHALETMPEFAFLGNDPDAVGQMKALSSVQYYNGHRRSASSEHSADDWLFPDQNDLLAMPAGAPQDWSAAVWQPGMPNMPAALEPDIPYPPVSQPPP